MKRPPRWLSCPKQYSWTYMAVMRDTDQHLFCSLCGHHLCNLQHLTEWPKDWTTKHFEDVHPFEADIIMRSKK